MKTYTAVYASEIPDWAAVADITVSEPVNGEDPNYNVRFKLAWNEGGLLIHASSDELYTRAMYSGPASPVWLDSFMGISLRPAYGDPRYFTLLVNSNNAVCCTVGASPEKRLRIIMLDEMESFRIKTSRYENGWNADFVFPTDLIRTVFPGYVFEAETVVGINCLKGGERTYFPHFLTWEPCPGPAYAAPHDCNYFGAVTLRSPVQ